jgi:hypothetical protein
VIEMADKAKDVENKIEEYFGIVSKSYVALYEAAMAAHQDIIAQLGEDTARRLNELIKQYNRDKASAGFLTDLIISVVAGPILGHLIELGMKRWVRNTLKTREEDIAVLKNMNRDANLGTMKPEGRDLDNMKKTLRQDLKIAEENLAARKNFYEFTTPLLNDVVQVVMPNSIKEFLGFNHEKNKSTIGEIYAKQTMANYSATISKVRDNVYSYVNMQNDFNDLWRRTYKQLVNIFSENDEIISGFNKYFDSRLKLLDGGSNYTGTIKTQYQELLEAFFWILYLGKPTKWKNDKPPGYEFEKIDLEEYQIELEIAGERTGYNVNPKGADYGTWIPPEYTESPGGYPEGGQVLARRPELFVYRSKFNIPRNLLSYLVMRFHDNFGNMSFYDSIKKMKQQAMRKSSGYGIDAAMPVTKDQIRRLTLADLLPQNFQSPYIEPTDPAGILLISWFKSLDEKLTTNNTLSKILDGKALGTMEKNFELTPLSK